jgi:hypothetical protein
MLQLALTTACSQTACTLTFTAKEGTPPDVTADPLAEALGAVLSNDTVLPLVEFEAQLEAPPFVPADEYLEMAVQVCVLLCYINSACVFTRVIDVCCN